MARPHENPTLTTTCANPLCGKVISTEYPFSEGFIVEEGGQRRVRTRADATERHGTRTESSVTRGTRAPPYAQCPRSGSHCTESLARDTMYARRPSDTHVVCPSHRVSAARRAGLIPCRRTSPRREEQRRGRAERQRTTIPGPHRHEHRRATRAGCGPHPPRSAGRLHKGSQAFQEFALAGGQRFGGMFELPQNPLDGRHITGQ